MTATPAERSYRALLRVPWLGRVIFGMQLVRIAESMVGVAMVLFALDRYDSPELAGLVTFFSIAPGLLVSPIAGALLDRHGRVRLVILDLIVACLTFVLIAGLAVADALPAWLLVLIAGVSSFTAPLGQTGLRSLFPLMAPEHLWERLNAIDANGYVVATIIGPPVAAVAFSLLGGPGALFVIALMFVVGAVVFRPVPEPPTTTVSSGRLLRDALDGVRYTLGNRTLLGIGLSITVFNLAGGMLTIVVPLLILERLGLPETVVGLVFALHGLIGMIVGLWAGRLDTRGREKRIFLWPMLAWLPALALLLVDAGLSPIALSMALGGLLSGPMDVAMFTLRQRRTDPAWIGRAFAVSMSLNFAGYPVGAALSGWLAASVSIEAAVVTGLVAACAGFLLGWRFIPPDER
jgi:MFS family permease